MNDIPLPKLLRQARKAVSREEFREAEDLYVSILTFPEMEDDLDIKLRYAYCAEKNENFDLAIQVYSEVVGIYRNSAEKGAAEALEQVIEGLKNGANEAEPEAEPELIGDIEPLDDAELMHQLCEMGELITLNPGELLCQEGDMPYALWLMRSGSLTVHLPDYDEPDAIVVKDNHLALVGEIGFFTNQRRGAALEASSRSELFAVDTAGITSREERDPAFKQAMERLFLERWAEPVLAHHTVFERINDIDRMRLMNVFERITLGPGETLIKDGEEHNSAYMLQSGCLFFMHSQEQPDDGFETDDGSIMESVFPGEIIHLGGLLNGYKSQYKVATATPVQVLRLSQKNFEPFTLRRPWITKAIQRFSQRPAHLQIMRPEDDYLWKADRHVKLDRIV